MRIKIKETGEIMDLVAIGINGVEWTTDMVEAGSLKYDEDADAHIMDAEIFEFWDRYIKGSEEDDEAIEGLAAEFDLDLDDVRNRVYAACAYLDNDQHHGARQMEIDAIRTEQVTARRRK